MALIIEKISMSTILVCVSVILIIVALLQKNSNF